jgi:hypothetical protein
LANWQFVMPYDEAAADWLGANGYPHPPARPGNRTPTWAEVEQAVESLGRPAGGPARGYHRGLRGHGWPSRPQLLPSESTSPDPIIQRLLPAGPRFFSCGSAFSTVRAAQR